MFFSFAFKSCSRCAIFVSFFRFVSTNTLLTSISYLFYPNMAVGQIVAKQATGVQVSLISEPGTRIELIAVTLLCTLQLYVFFKFDIVYPADLFNILSNW